MGGERKNAENGLPDDRVKRVACAQSLQIFGLPVPKVCNHAKCGEQMDQYKVWRGVLCEKISSLVNKVNGCNNL